MLTEGPAEQRPAGAKAVADDPRAAEPAAGEGAGDAAVEAAPKRGRTAAYWICAAALYALLGTWHPELFLLGFWEAFPYVLLVTWLAPRVIRRLP